MPPPPPSLFPRGRFVALLASGGCSSRNHLRQVHAVLETSGLLSGDRFLASELVRAFALSPSGGDTDYARHLLFARLLAPSSASWNHVIRGYARGGSGPLPRDAVGVFMEMRRRGGPSARPSELTYPFVLNAAAGMGNVHLGRQVHADAVKGGVVAVVYVGNTLVHLYGTCREITDARRAFNEMPIRTVVSWNTMLSVYNENSLFSESIQLCSCMRSSMFEPDEITFVVLLSAAAEVGNLSLGMWVHCQVIGRGMTMNVQLGTALVDMYAKSGAIDRAGQVFERTSKTNVWTWSAMILGLAQHGFAHEALKLFSQMKKTAIKPNYVTFLGVLCACSHAGLVEEGYRSFHEMALKHGIEPKMSHYSAMVDVLGRSGRLEEAHAFIRSMPVEPDAVVWRTLLSACNTHNTSDDGAVGSRARWMLLELEPRRSGNYVMAANMFAEVGLWDEAAKMRRVMREGGMKKMAGESCVELWGFLMRFVSGESSRVGREGAYCLLDGLNSNMKMDSCVGKDCLTEMLLE
ncbi:hypothetical protein Taro_025679 [Colocasia esculenta]|uniref:Pentatricopeptide repeat-containing protein n=1 Tax=Colocasia esculenta TaxID=4460 RepID=A0A843V9G9_COLES|nr:hypothetical protein [Colocasia esculenta]